MNNGIIFILLIISCISMIGGILLRENEMMGMYEIYYKGWLVINLIIGISIVMYLVNGAILEMNSYKSIKK